MTGLKVGLLTMVFGTGGAITVAQLPVVPDGFQDWRAAAILGFLLLVALGIICFMVKNIFSVMTGHTQALIVLAEKQGQHNEQQATTNTRLEELCAKIGRG